MVLAARSFLLTVWLLITMLILAILTRDLALPTPAAGSAGGNLCRLRAPSPARPRSAGVRRCQAWGVSSPLPANDDQLTGPVVGGVDERLIRRAV